MSRKVNPIVIAAAIIFLVALLGFLFMRTLAPTAPAYTVSPPSLDADGAAAKRANMLKARGIAPPPGTAEGGKMPDRQ